MGSLSLRMQSFGRIAGLLLGFCMATATLAAPQKPTDEEVENAIQIVTTNSTTLGPGEGFRCGVFFAGEKTEDPPIETIMVLPRRFAMDCTQPRPNNRNWAKKNASICS